MKTCGDCWVDPMSKVWDPAVVANARAACLTISGMGCANCATRVRNSLLKIDGVHVVEIAIQDGLAVVAFDRVKVQPVDLVKAVGEAGDGRTHRYWARVNAIMAANEALALG